MLLLTGRDVWEAIVKLRWVCGSYDPETYSYLAYRDTLMGLLK